MKDLISQLFVEQSFTLMSTAFRVSNLLQGTQMLINLQIQDNGCCYSQTNYKSGK
jgi:hypothetical protein